MGVYIDMEKPKGCYYCPLEQLSECRLLDNKFVEEIDPNDCPLIEIEEWNSYGHGKMYAPKGTFQKILDDERRADEGTTE